MTSFDVTRPETPWVIFGPRGATEFKEQAAALLAASGRVYEVHACDLADEAGVLDAFARVVGVPGYFGWNWDALVDCLDDLHEPVTGGVGIVVVVHGADVLLGADHLKVFTTMLCLAADRANTAVDPDAGLRDQPVVIEHFVFLLDDVRAEEFAAGIEDPDVVVRVEGDFLTVALNLDAWRPEAAGRPKVSCLQGTQCDSRDRPAPGPSACPYACHPPAPRGGWRRGMGLCFRVRVPVQTALASSPAWWGRRPVRVVGSGSVTRVVGYSDSPSRLPSVSR
ncbi:barstar family protein [Streptomyces sp. M-16]|uniref:barstar family protein n=1 Tax=Streptomyces sp. M-16 TaxID=3233040 RepID=UPI003F95D765